MRYFSAKAETLETKLPNLSASSLLFLSTNAFSEKSPSFPSANGICLAIKYLTASTPYLSTKTIGEIALPRDFDIFSPLKVKNPWIKTVFGSFSPADFRKAGQ